MSQKFIAVLLREVQFKFQKRAGKLLAVIQRAFGQVVEEHHAESRLHILSLEGRHLLIAVRSCRDEYDILLCELDLRRNLKFWVVHRPADSLAIARKIIFVAVPHGKMSKVPPLHRDGHPVIREE